MRLWHNTEDAPRLPDKVLEGQRVEVWISTYPLAPWHYVMVDWKLTHKNGTMESGSVPAFWKYNDLSLRQSYWLALLGPFQQGDWVEYAVVGMSDVETLSPQVFAFNIEQQQRIINMVKDPVCGMNIDGGTAAATSEYNGTTYYFCAPGCKRVFENNPKRFLSEQNKILEAMCKPLTKYIDAQPKHIHLRKESFGQTREGK